MSKQAEVNFPEPIRNGGGASILGPRNVPLEMESPNLLASPETDDGTIPSLKFSFSAARNPLLTGGPKTSQRWSTKDVVRLYARPLDPLAWNVACLCQATSQGSPTTPIRQRKPPSRPPRLSLS